MKYLTTDCVVRCQFLNVKASNMINGLNRSLIPALFNNTEHQIRNEWMIVTDVEVVMV
jgi:hypothetical protein